MDDDWRKASCVGKEAFSDPQAARAVITRIKASSRSSRLKRPGNFARREAYRCRYCNLWHIGFKGRG